MSSSIHASRPHYSDLIAQAYGVTISNVMKIGLKTTIALLLLAVVALITPGIILLQEKVRAARYTAPWPVRLPHVRLDPLRPPLRDHDVKPGNAFYFIRQIQPIKTEFPATEWTNFEHTGILEGNYTSLSAWFELNTTNISLLQQASLVSNCQMKTCDSYETLLPYLSPFRALSRTLCFHAESAASTNEWREALESWRTVLIVNAHASRGGPLIHQLVMYADTSICCESIRRIALTTEMPTTESRQLLSLLENTDRDMEPFAESMRYERLAVQDLILKIYGRGPSTIKDAWGLNDESDRKHEWLEKTIWQLERPFLHLMGNSPSNTNSHIDDFYSHIIDIAGAPNGTSRFEKEIERFLQNTNEAATLNDGMGRIIARMTVSTVPSALNHFLRTLTDLRATRIHLAVQLYRKDHNGDIPENLQVLVPDYLPEVPKDPFMKNANMSYHVSNSVWTVYSVGPNQEDDHGNFDYSTDRYKQPDFCYPSDEYQRNLQDLKNIK